MALLEGWEESASPVLRRRFGYHQARLRWTGRTPPDNTAALLTTLERTMATAHPEVQWAMNLCADWIGVHDPGFRSSCISLGAETGLYQHDPVARNCTPSCLPDFIRIETAKRER